MVGLRLVRLIEKHAEELAQSLTEKLRNSERTQHFANVRSDEMRSATVELYRHIGEWLLSKTESDIEVRYRQVGQRRAAQGIPMSEFVWAMVMSKENLWAFLQREAVSDQPVEIYGELELLQLLDQFFERAIYYGVVGFTHGHQRASA